MSKHIANTFESLQDLIRDIRFAMFTTRRADGHLCARPMTNQSAKDNPPPADTLWFFMSRRSDTVQELIADPIVNVSFAEPKEDTYVSITGQAVIIEDRIQKERFWSAPVKAWFPDGLDDPNLALVCVQIHGAEYWSTEEGKLMQMATMAKAALTGTPPVHMGEHGKVK